MLLPVSLASRSIETVLYALTHPLVGFLWFSSPCLFCCRKHAPKKHARESLLPGRAAGGGISYFEGPHSCGNWWCVLSKSGALFSLVGSSCGEGSAVNRPESNAATDSLAQALEFAYCPTSCVRMRSSQKGARFQASLFCLRWVCLTSSHLEHVFATKSCVCAQPLFVHHGSSNCPSPFPLWDGGVRD